MKKLQNSICNPEPRITKLVLILCTCFISEDVYAFKFSESICREYGLGKNWYCEYEDNTSKELTAEDILNAKIPSEEKAVRINELWELQRKRAVITGKREDIEQFLNTQHFIAEKGISFARNVQKVLETTPRYSSSESYYRNVSEDAIRTAERDLILKNSSKEYGIVFIYSSSCSYCQRQLPVITEFSREYNFKVLGISIDGGKFNGLTENMINPEVMKEHNIQSVPTVFLLDKRNRRKIFLSQGLVTLDELKERIVNRVEESENEDN